MAPPGRLLLAADYSQIEARILAWYAVDTRVLEDFRKYDETGDPQFEVYCRAASVILGRTVTKAERNARGIGKVATLALGYGGGLGAWRNYDENTPEPEVRRHIAAWRKSRAATVAFWKMLDDALRRAIGEPGTKLGLGPLGIWFENEVLHIRLPSGRMLRFPGADVVDGRFEETWNIRFRKWERGKWKPTEEWFGKFVATVVSATARDLMAAAMLRIATAGFDIVLTVHDEIVAEIPDDGVDRWEEFVRLMTQLPDWAEGLPVVADARCGRRYIKADESQIEDLEDEEEPVGQSEPAGTGRQSEFNGAGGNGGGNQARNDFERYADRSFEEGKQYHVVRDGLLRKGYRLTESHPYTVPGISDPLYIEDRYEKNTLNGHKPDKTYRFRHRVNGIELAGTGPRRVPWNWPVIIAAGPGSTVYITEGPRKSAALCKAGMLATAAACHQWSPECVAALSGLNLIYLEDHDLPDSKGRIKAKDYSTDARHKLAGAAASFKIIPGKALWQDLGRNDEPPHGFDVFDWLARGGTAERLSQLSEHEPDLDLVIFDAGDDTKSPPPRGWLQGNQFCRRNKEQAEAFGIAAADRHSYIGLHKGCAISVVDPVSRLNPTSREHGLVGRFRNSTKPHENRGRGLRCS